MIDLDLRMHSVIDQLLSKIRPKSIAILRTRAYYSDVELIQQYKTHIWCLTEMHCGDYFQVASDLLVKIDRVQKNLLVKLEISEGHAFLDFNVASSDLKR